MLRPTFQLAKNHPQPIKPMPIRDVTRQYQGAEISVRPAESSLVDHVMLTSQEEMIGYQIY